MENISLSKSIQIGNQVGVIKAFDRVGKANKERVKHIQGRILG